MLKISVQIKRPVGGASSPDFIAIVRSNQSRQDAAPTIGVLLVISIIHTSIFIESPSTSTL